MQLCYQNHNQSDNKKNTLFYHIYFNIIIIMNNDKILNFPNLNIFGGWDDLQDYLTKKGNPSYSIDGDLDFRFDYSLTSLGSLVLVKGDLKLSFTKIESLGNLTSVEGFLNLSGCKNLTCLGNLSYVGGGISLINTPISKTHTEEDIKQMIKVGGSIYL